MPACDQAFFHPRHRARRQRCLISQQPAQGQLEVAARQPVQIQIRQQISHLFGASREQRQQSALEPFVQVSHARAAAPSPSRSSSSAASASRVRSYIPACPLRGADASRAPGTGSPRRPASAASTPGCALSSTPPTRSGVGAVYMRHQSTLRGCVQNKSNVEFSPLSATKSYSTSESVATMEGRTKKCLRSATLDLRICCSKPESGSQSCFDTRQSHEHLVLSTPSKLDRLNMNGGLRRAGPHRLSGCRTGGNAFGVE